MHHVFPIYGIKISNSLHAASPADRWQETFSSILGHAACSSNLRSVPIKRVRRLWQTLNHSLIARPANHQMFFENPGLEHTLYKYIYIPGALPPIQVPVRSKRWIETIDLVTLKPDLVCQGLYVISITLQRWPFRLSILIGILHHFASCLRLRS